MKKFSLCILAGLLALVLYLEPFSVKAETLPGTDAPTVSMTSISLEESEKWILDEVLSDYVSEHVVNMEEASVPCTIGELIDRAPPPISSIRMNRQTEPFIRQPVML